MLEYENKYIAQNKNIIAGIDEAGRGPLAGPVVVACAVMPLDSIIEGVDDSKKLSAKKREILFDKIINDAKEYSVSIVSEKDIDRINILNATKRGMEECVKKLHTTPDIVLVDAVNGLNIDVEYLPIIKGDSLSYSIACASIIAKVTRDRLMRELDKKFPEYDFATHKGYGTAKHIELLKKYGACEIHRKSFITHFIGDANEQ